MRRGHVRLSGLVHFFLDLDTAGGGSCWAQAKGQVYWYVG